MSKRVGETNTVKNDGGAQMMVVLTITEILRFYDLVRPRSSLYF